MRTLEAVEHKCENPGTTRPVLKEGRTPEVECDLLEEFSCQLWTQELAGKQTSLCRGEMCIQMALVAGVGQVPKYYQI